MRHALKKDIVLIFFASDPLLRAFRFFFFSTFPFFNTLYSGKDKKDL